jgi:hypothetical protein
VRKTVIGQYVRIAKQAGVTALPLAEKAWKDLGEKPW